MSKMLVGVFFNLKVEERLRLDPKPWRLVLPGDAPPPPTTAGGEVGLNESDSMPHIGM